MTEERWQEIVSTIEENFKVEDRGVKEVEEDGGEKIEFIIFAGPLGRMKVEWTTRPRVIDKKTTYANRIGSSVRVDYIYSPDEKIQKFKAYKWAEEQNDWLELEAGAGFKI